MEANGTKAQGNNNPRSEFDNHVVIKYGDLLLDPSYGSDILSNFVTIDPDHTFVDYENRIAGYGYTFQYFQNIGGNNYYLTYNLLTEIENNTSAQLYFNENY